MAGIRAEWPGFGYWWEQGFIVCHHVHVGPETHSSPCAESSCGCFAKDEVAWRSARHAPASNVEADKVCGCASDLPYTLKASCLAQE